MEFQLDEAIDGIGDKGDQLIIKQDGTWEVKKSQSIDELLIVKAEIEKKLSERQENVIENIVKNDDAWIVLNKLYDSGHIDSTALLKEQLTKIAACKDVTKLFNELIDDYKSKGEGDVVSIEKIINSCKSEGGNVGGRDDK